MSQLELKAFDFNSLMDKLNIKISNATKYYYDTLYSLSTTIFEKRIDMEMNQTQFANYLGVSQAMVSKYESGDYNFTVKQLCNLADKLNMIPQFSLFDAVKLSSCNYEPKSSYIDTTTTKKIEEAA